MKVTKLLELALNANLPIPIAHIRSAVDSVMNAVRDGQVALTTDERAELDAIHEKAMNAAQNLDRAAGQRASETE